MAVDPGQGRPLLYFSLETDPPSCHPVAFFMLENLLRARADSSFPTATHGDDEDVNVYIAHLLTEHLEELWPACVQSGAMPLLQGAAERQEGGAEVVEHYRRNGDHRLLCLGLYERGDLLRRRQTVWGMSVEQTRERDMAIGRHCYQAAVGILQTRHNSQVALLPVLSKLAVHFAAYVHVLQVLARRRFGLGARLGGKTLQELMPSTAADGSAAANPSGEDMDLLLDRLSAHRRNPSPQSKQRLLDLARLLGIPAKHILGDS